MKKILSFLLLAVILTVCFTSCSDDITYTDITYRENGLEVVLPEGMRRSYTEGYDMYFSTPDMIFTATKIDAELLEKNDIPLSSDVTSKEYTDFVIKSFDKDQLYFREDASKNLYNFRYTYEVEDGQSELFYYVVVIGEPGNVWYIEMCCEQDNSSTYLSDFELWKKYIKTYSE